MFTVKTEGFFVFAALSWQKLTVSNWENNVSSLRFQLFSAAVSVSVTDSVDSSFSFYFKGLWSSDPLKQKEKRSSVRVCLTTDICSCQDRTHKNQPIKPTPDTQSQDPVVMAQIAERPWVHILKWLASGGISCTY